MRLRGYRGLDGFGTLEYCTHHRGAGPQLGPTGLRYFYVAAGGGNAADVLLVRSTGRGTHVGRAIGGRVAER